MRRNMDQHDWIQESVIDQAKRLGLSAQDIARLSGVAEDHVKSFLSRRASIGSHKLQHVIRALGGTIQWDSQT